ncbi:VWA domain-containing protein [bacterium]|nr:VWA domain-containing protein [bacterium]
MEWERPLLLWALAALPLLWWLLGVHRLRSQKRIETVMHPDNARRLLMPMSTGRYIGRVGLHTTAWACTIVALANPQLGFESVPMERKGMELVFALDVSNSMLCEDVQPSRLLKAKQLIKSILDRRTGDKVGLVVYAGSAYPLLPLTHDYAAAALFLADAQPDQVDRQGTQLDNALITGAELFSSESGMSRALVLVSDGEDHSGASEAVASELKEKGIRLFSLGVGTETGGPIPLRDDFGQMNRYLKDSEGQTVLTRARPDLLNALASRGGGVYLSADDTRKTAEQLEGEWANMDKMILETNDLKQRDSLFPIFVALAALALLIDFLIPETSKKWQRIQSA